MVKSGPMFRLCQRLHLLFFLGAVGATGGLSWAQSPPAELRALYKEADLDPGNPCLRAAIPIPRRSTLTGANACCRNTSITVALWRPSPCICEATLGWPKWRNKPPPRLSKGSLIKRTGLKGDEARASVAMLPLSVPALAKPDGNGRTVVVTARPTVH